ncbi:MAG: LytTR family DNA-binding domain-containing protein [Bacteroidota bacterium]
MKIKVLIVDDEPRAHSVLQNYIARMPELELAGDCFNAIEAYQFLKKEEVQLLFLDITMPEIDGFGFLRMLETPPNVIFTTAHSEFAVESYDYNAIDYLKKPIPFERFLKAVNKAMHQIENHVAAVPQKKSIELKIDGEMQPVQLDKIFYIQSLGNYVKIFMDKKNHLIQVTTKELEELLPKNAFLRIHKSFIVNRSRISQVSDEEIVLGETKLPIGKTFKKYVKETVGRGN